MKFDDANIPRKDERGAFNQEAFDKWFKEVGFGIQHNPQNLQGGEDPRYVDGVPLIEQRYRTEVLEKQIKIKNQERIDKANNALLG